PLRPWKREQLGAGYEMSLWMEREGLLACDAVIAVSRDMKADIQKADPIPASKVAVIHNGVDPQKYYPRDGAESLAKFMIRKTYGTRPSAWRRRPASRRPSPPGSAAPRKASSTRRPASSSRRVNPRNWAGRSHGSSRIPRRRRRWERLAGGTSSSSSPGTGS